MVVVMASSSGDTIYECYCLSSIYGIDVDVDVDCVTGIARGDEYYAFV